jgi:hypothetical protein
MLKGYLSRMPHPDLLFCMQSPGWFSQTRKSSNYPSGLLSVMPERSTKVLNGHVSMVIELGLRVSCLRSPDSVRVPTDSDPTGLLRVLASWRLVVLASPS